MIFFSLNEIDTKKRYPDIDSLRGLGVILMFLGHAFAWWLPRTQYGANDLYWYIRILSGLSPILFLFILGYSMVLYNISLFCIIFHGFASYVRDYGVQSYSKKSPTVTESSFPIVLDETYSAYN